jgi:16S rRNA (cytidine1402-2'-O)-methyltransferase
VTNEWDERPERHPDAAASGAPDDRRHDSGGDIRTPEGVLVLAGTPIGDVADAPPRLAAELAGADVVAAEDTRRLRRLAQALGVRPAGRVVSYFEGNEAARTPDLVAALADGARVLLVTDAGMPSVSDPGYRLVAAAVERGIRVTAVPGPSAVLTALALSGLPVDRFCFEGFLPRKAGERRARLAEAAPERRTLVYFEAPHRLEAALVAMAEAFGGGRRAAVCRELTKTYEEVRRGTLGELAAWAAPGVRGEITVVVAGAPDVREGAAPDADELVRRVRAREEAGERRKEAIAAVATEARIPKREVFDAVVTAKNAARSTQPHTKGLS